VDGRHKPGHDDKEAPCPAPLAPRALPQTQNDPEGGIPSGSLEVLGGLTKPYVSFIGGKFFRLMLCFVSIVSSAVTLPCPG
jgi:hypothetical protein